MLNEMEYFEDASDAWVNQLRIGLVNERVKEAFISGGLEVAYDYSGINLNCVNAPMLLAGYMGIVCDECHQEYCAYQGLGASFSPCQDYNFTVT